MEHTITINLPDIGEGVAEGEVIEWLKKPGDEIKKDEPVVIVMTDKATVELPSQYPGILTKQYYHAGSIALVGKPLYEVQIQDAIVTRTDQPVADVTGTEDTPRVKIPEKEPDERQQQRKDTKVRAAPPVRRLAKELKVDLHDITSTGKHGDVTKDDIINYLKRSPKADSTANFPKFQDDVATPLTGMRRVMADKMYESTHNSAHFSYFEQLDATRLILLKNNVAEEGKKEGETITYMPFFIRALSKTLSKYPQFNSNYDAATHTLITHKVHNIGIAIRSDAGLVVPVLHGVENMTLRELIKSYNVLIKKATSGKLTVEELKGSTFTITNFGVLSGGGRWATPVINYPEIGILGVAKIRKQPLIKNEEIVVCDTLNLSWSFDHRVIDGDMAASFSHDFAMLLQNPAPLL